MAALEVILEGDPRLRQKAVKVRRVDDEVRRLMRDMHESMCVEKGVGLAAPQVGILRRVIVICVPEARRRAKEQRSSARNELLLYAIHGMLHLCGFDDRTEAAFQKMHRMEDDILIRLGLGPVFEPADSSRSTRALASRRGRSRRA